MGVSRKIVCNYFLSRRILFLNEDLFGSGKYRKKSRFGVVDYESSFKDVDRRVLEGCLFGWEGDLDW